MLTDLPVGYLLPKKELTPMKFLKQIMANKKRVLLQKQYKGRDVPSYPELAIKKIYPLLTNEFPLLKTYLPDPEGKTDKRLPHRDFFFKVCQILHPQRLETLVADALEKRDRTKMEAIHEIKYEFEMSPEWINNMLKYQFKSCKWMSLRY